jgi:hypothetical protein
VKTPDSKSQRDRVGKRHAHPPEGISRELWRGHGRDYSLSKEEIAALQRDHERRLNPNNTENFEALHITRDHKMEHGKLMARHYRKKKASGEAFTEQGAKSEATKAINRARSGIPGTPGAPQTPRPSRDTSVHGHGRGRAYTPTVSKRESASRRRK